LQISQRCHHCAEPSQRGRISFPRRSAVRDERKSSTVSERSQDPGPCGNFESCDAATNRTSRSTGRNCLRLNRHKTAMPPLPGWIITSRRRRRRRAIYRAAVMSPSQQANAANDTSGRLIKTRGNGRNSRKHASHSVGHHIGIKTRLRTNSTPHSTSYLSAGTQSILCARTPANPTTPSPNCGAITTLRPEPLRSHPTANQHSRTSPCPPPPPIRR